MCPELNSRLSRGAPRRSQGSANMAVSGSGDAAAAPAADEDDHSLTEVEPFIKEEEKEVEMVRPAVPQLELSRRLSDSDDEAGMVAMKGTPKDDDEMEDDDDDDDKKGSGKIKIEFIANRRARGATFNKRRNGILKKAYEVRFGRVKLSWWGD